MKRKQPQSLGFTLVELMVVLVIIAVSAALVTLALPNSDGTLLAREAERLAALLESARAQSRAAGVPVIWHTTERGFAFDGLPPLAEPMPGNWLDAHTTAAASAPLLLGPEPVIGAQQVLLRRAGSNQLLRVGTDGLRPFVVEPVQ